MVRPEKPAPMMTTWLYLLFDMVTIKSEQRIRIKKNEKSRMGCD
jgi:hypothetical protein